MAKYYRLRLATMDEDFERIAENKTSQKFCSYMALSDSGHIATRFALPKCSASLCTSYVRHPLYAINFMIRT